MNINILSSPPVSASVPQDILSSGQANVDKQASQSFVFADAALGGGMSQTGENAAFSDLASSTFQSLKTLMAQFSGVADQTADAADGASYADSLADAFDVSNMSTAKKGKVPRVTTREVDGKTIESFSSSPRFALDKKIRNDEGKLVDDKLSGHFLEGKNEDTERFRVAKGQPKQSSGLDPRVEAVFNETIKPKDKQDYVFTGQYNVVSAKDTTIFQILSTDKSLPVTTGDRQPGDPVVDRHHPVLFLEAETRMVKNERMVKVVDRESGKTVYDGPSEFRLKVELDDGKKATITAHPEGKAHESKVTKDIYFDRDPDTKGRQPGDALAVRYGAYHHDNDRSKGDPSNTTANILVTKAKLETVE